MQFRGKAGVNTGFGQLEAVDVIQMQCNRVSGTGLIAHQFFFGQDLAGDAADLLDADSLQVAARQGAWFI